MNDYGSVEHIVEHFIDRAQVARFDVATVLLMLLLLLLRLTLPFEVSVFPKFHSSAFSGISHVQIEKLAQILRDVLQKLDKTLGGPPYNLALQDRPFLRPREGYWKTIEEDFHWHLEILPQVIGMTGFERASWFFYNPVPPELAARCLSG